MSILIKGLQMPKDKQLLIVLNPNGKLFVANEAWFTEYEAVELPDHGDLIEKRPIVDALAVAEKNVSFIQRGIEREENIKYCQGVMVGYANSILAIDNAPVVIPAERSESDE